MSNRAAEFIRHHTLYLDRIEAAIVGLESISRTVAGAGTGPPREHIAVLRTELKGLRESDATTTFWQHTDGMLSRLNKLMKKSVQKGRYP